VASYMAHSIPAHSLLSAPAERQHSKSAEPTKTNFKSLPPQAMCNAAYT